MIRIICTLLLLILFVSHSRCQTFASSSLSAAIIPSFQTSSSLPLSLAAYIKHKEAKKVMVAGFIGMGAGATLFVLGIGIVVAGNEAPINNANGTVNHSNDNTAGIGTGVAIGGAAVFIAGTVMAIYGGANIYSRHRWTVVSRRNDQLGIVYNFR